MISILNYITWNPSPTIFSIGGLEIRWYGLLFATSFLLGYLILKKILTQENFSVDLAEKLSFYLFLGCVIGLRLGHVLFYEPNYYFSHPIEILKVWKGGLASHGAAIGIIIALLLFVRKHKVNMLWLLDRIVIVVAFIAIFIRIANLTNSEIYGKPTDVPWAFIFVQEDNLPRHPSQIYEAFSYLCIFLFLFFYYKKNKTQLKQGILFGMFLTMVFGVRFLIEFLKDVQVEWERNLLLNMGQILSIPFILTGLFFIYRSNKISNNKI